MTGNDFRNIARGHAVVGSQIGMVNGPVNTVAGADSTIKQQFIAVREALDHEHAVGSVTPEVYTSAEHEIAEAASVLPGSPSGDPSRFLGAIRRLAAVLEGVVGVAAPLAALIASARELA